MTNLLLLIAFLYMFSSDEFLEKRFDALNPPFLRLLELFRHRFSFLIQGTLKELERDVVEQRNLLRESMFKQENDDPWRELGRYQMHQIISSVPGLHDYKLSDKRFGDMSYKLFDAQSTSMTMLTGSHFLEIIVFGEEQYSKIGVPPPNPVEIFLVSDRFAV